MRTNPNKFLLFSIQASIACNMTCKNLEVLLSLTTAPFSHPAFQGLTSSQLVATPLDKVTSSEEAVRTIVFNIYPTHWDTIIARVAPLLMNTTPPMGFTFTFNLTRFWTCYSKICGFCRQ